MQKFLYVYILKCADKSYYTGVTNNPERRLIEHNTSFNKDSYTYSRRPVEMVYLERFTDYNLAISWEKRIKDWSRKKKEALINGYWEELKKAAECQNSTSHKIFWDLLHYINVHEDVSQEEELMNVTSSVVEKSVTSSFVEKNVTSSVVEKGLGA